MKIKKHIVCLGGGIGTVNLIRGLKAYTDSLTVVVSMADDGGSSGRLRRLYHILPPGDLVSCMAAMRDGNDSFFTKLLTYRFPGDRYGADESLCGQKLGNLLMVAMRDISGEFEDAVQKFQTLFAIPGRFLPATLEDIHLFAKTIEGQVIKSEETIDRGKYNGKRVLSKVWLEPKNPKTTQDVLNAIKTADVILAGPGDLYTTILPVLLIKDIAQALKTSDATKLFIVNVANKPFETKGYSVEDFLAAIRKHLGFIPFTKIIINNNYAIPIPRKYHYTYVTFGKKPSDSSLEVIAEDLLDESFPLYHSSQKLAKAVFNHI